MPHRQRRNCHLPFLVLAALCLPAVAQESEATAATVVTLASEPDKPDEPDKATTIDPESTPAILESIRKAIHDELENTPYQGLLALVAFVFGCVLVFDGEFSFQSLVACAVFISVAVTAMNQVGSAWGLGFEDPVRYLVGIEAGAIGTFAALRGMDGMRVVIGALLGVLVSASMLQWHPLHFIPDHKWLEVIWYSVVVCLFTVVLYTNKHLKMLAILSAGLGGAFCASAIAFAVTNLAAGGYLNFLDQVLPGLTPKGGTWVQFFRMLWSTQNPVVGLFVGSKYNPVVEGKQFNVDRMADISVWLIFWIVGCVVQLRRIKSKPQQAVSAMTEPLLGELPK